MLNRKPGTALKRAPLPARKNRIAHASPGLCATKRVQRRAYQAAAETEAPWCVCCGDPAAPEHSHLFSQGRWQQHRSNPLNWLLKCRACHSLFEDNKAGFAARYPVVWVEVLRRMRLVDAAAFAEFEMKHSDLIPTT